MRLVLDASIVIKVYAREPDTAAATRWFAPTSVFAAPDIFLVEVMQALLRHAREHRLPPSELPDISADLTKLVQVPATSADLMGSALSFAHVLNHRLHDCMYLALAERLGCPLLTADERLARKVDAADLTIPIRLHTETPS